MEVGAGLLQCHQLPAAPSGADRRGPSRSGAPAEARHGRPWPPPWPCCRAGSSGRTSLRRRRWSRPIASAAVRRRPPPSHPLSFGSASAGPPPAAALSMGTAPAHQVGAVVALQDHQPQVEPLVSVGRAALQGRVHLAPGDEQVAGRSARAVTRRERRRWAVVEAVDGRARAAASRSSSNRRPASSASEARTADPGAGDERWRAGEEATAAVSTSTRRVRVIGCQSSEKPVNSASNSSAATAGEDAAPGGGRPCLRPR